MNINKPAFIYIIHMYIIHIHYTYEYIIHIYYIYIYIRYKSFNSKISVGEIISLNIVIIKWTVGF